MDATIAIQSFVLNLDGCIDNLAWIWVSEKPVKATNGKDLDPKSVGLRRTYALVRKSLSSDFRRYLDEREPWFDHVKGFRDALAHRIPLYIPPFAIQTSNRSEADRLQQEANAALRRSDFQGYDLALAEQQKLGEFRPWMLHSLADQFPAIIFHGQLLSDYATIEELAERMFVELDTLGAP